MDIGRKHSHLDHHNHESTKDIASEFDPEAFARAFRSVGVHAVNVFAKDVHGMSYCYRDIGSLRGGLVQPGQCTSDPNEVTKDVLDLVRVLDDGESMHFSSAKRPAVSRERNCTSSENPNTEQTSGSTS